LAIAVPEFFPKKDLRQRPSQEPGAHHEKRRVEKDSDISALQSEHVAGRRHFANPFSEGLL